MPRQAYTSWKGFNVNSWVHHEYCLSTGGGLSIGGPLWGPPFISFCFISVPSRCFVDFNLLAVSAHFWPLYFFIPRRWTILWWSPMGSPFDLFLFYISPLADVFLTSICWRFLLIFDLYIFLLCGWVMGDGWWVGPKNVLGFCSKFFQMNLR